jgi:hypothetical protein
VYQQILYVDEEFPGGPALRWAFSGNGLEVTRLEDWLQILWQLLYSLLKAPRCRFVKSKTLHYVRQRKSDIGRKSSKFTPPPNKVTA